MRVVRRGAALSLDAVPEALSYAPVGRAFDALPAGFGHLDRRWPLPAGSHDRAVAAVLGWEMHRGSGLRVLAGPMEPGSPVLQAFPLGPVELLAPCCIVSVRTDGFSYGTVAGHPESGEESFAVHEADGLTWLEIRSYSRPGAAWMRPAARLTRLVQLRAVQAYADALLALL